MNEIEKINILSSPQLENNFINKHVGDDEDEVHDYVSYSSIS